MGILSGIKKMFFGSGSREEEELIKSRKITPDEVELKSYLEQERRDNIKKMLRYYRAKQRQEILVGQKMEVGKNMLNSKNVFKGMKNVFK